jgi:hypothetical protein
LIIRHLLAKPGARANRINLLLIGHRRAWNEPLELWDDAYLATAEFYGQVARWNNGVDAMIGSESARRQKHFLDGLGRAVRRKPRSPRPQDEHCRF